MRPTQFEDNNERLQEITERNVITRETHEIQGKAVNDNDTSNFIIMSSPRQATGKDSKRQIQMTQHQLKQDGDTPRTTKAAEKRRKRAIAYKKEKRGKRGQI